ncbi:MAG: hypothetical protein Q9186_002440 [Xanthomendoza sp. 1 TL-2023]
MSTCCISGFSWDGTPSGREDKSHNINYYAAGDNKEVAILFLHDLFGWTFNNSRLLADHFAQEVNATVFLPDLLRSGHVLKLFSPSFDGEVIPEDAIFNPEKKLKIDIGAWKERHGKEIRGPAIHVFAEKLKKETGFKKVGAIGYCWGGWATFQLGAKGKNLVDAISTAHPSFLTKEEIDAVAVPVQILAPETDGQLTPELKEYANSVIPSLGVDYDYQYFPGLAHGFACRADTNNKVEKQGLERAKNAASSWFAQMLHIQ